MASSTIPKRRKAVSPKKSAARTSPASTQRKIAAAEFKAKCLAILDEVGKTGQEVIITKRGRATAKLIPFVNPAQKEPILGRLEDIGEIVGDPDDLIKPVFPLEDYDMLK